MPKSPNHKPKLSDTQLVILSAAAGRVDRSALPLPKTLKARGAALQKSLGSLLNHGLLEETPARHDEPHWRTDEDGRPVTLRITESGLAALDSGPEAEAAAPAAVGANPKRTRGTAKSKMAGRKRKSKTGGNERSETMRAGSKGATILELLRRPRGA